MLLQCIFHTTCSCPNIPSAIDQQQGETYYAKQLFSNLPLVFPTRNCSEKIRPFLCLHIFGLCDSSGNLHTTQREECLRLRDDVCSSEWTKALSFLPPGALPVCEDLPDPDEECMGNVSVVPRSPLTCSDGFFYDQNRTELCRPECGEFECLGSGLVMFERVSVCIGLLFSIAMFIHALTFQRSTLLAFPAILQVYICATTLLLTVTAVIGFFDNTKLFCRSRDQLTSSYIPGQETAFCIFSGFVFHYCSGQVCVWGLLHAVFLFWGVNFPFSYKRLRDSGRMRYVHIISILLALILPLPGAVIPLKSGFISFRNSTLLCIGRDLDYGYYSIVLPLSIVLTIMSYLLAVTIWVIFKEFGLKKLARGKQVRRIRSAQVKINVIVIYYTLAGVMALTSITFIRSINPLNQILELIDCESTGNQDCDTNLDVYNTYTVLAVVTGVMISFTAPVAFLISINFSVCLKKAKALFVTLTSMFKSKLSNGSL